MALNPAYRMSLCRYWTNPDVCRNRADGTVWHPYYGDIPICKRCADLVGLEIKFYESEGAKNEQRD